MIRKMGMESYNMLITINIKVIGKTVKGLERDYISMQTEILIMVNG